MKKRSLSQKLFRTYVGWFTLYLFVLLCVSVIFLSYIVRKDIGDTHEQLVKSIDENVQNYFDEMNAFSIKLLNSNDFKQIAINKIPENYKVKRGTSELFSKLYQEAYEMIPLKYSIGIIVDNKYYIWMGRHYYVSSFDSNSIHTYDELVKNEVPVVKKLNRNEYLETTSPQKEGRSYITLSRSMDNRKKYVNGRAILEIQVEQEDFIDEMMKLSVNDNEAGLQIHIYDSNGEPIYNGEDKELSQYIRQNNVGKYKYGKNMVVISKVFNDNITIVYTKDSGAYYNKLLIFWGVSIGLSLFVIGIMVAMTYKISKQISKPIHEMCQNVNQINIKEGSGYKEIVTDIDELQFLSDSLEEMSKQIAESLQQIILLKDYEVHAKMLALQAQMQPHFLFNTLTTIASMAEEEGNKKIYRICMNLNSMFRYITAKDCGGIRMFEEIKHMGSYVEIMKERFPDSQVDIDIPLELMSCMIPKLTIQPLIENAFKYCNRQKPKILVVGAIESTGKWTVEVLDNGKGFTIEKKEEIMQKCVESLENERTLSNQIDGMGLVNVYVRLKLFYGEENMTYFIEENKGRIVIGGSTDAGTKE